MHGSFLDHTRSTAVAYRSSESMMLEGDRLRLVISEDVGMARTQR
jgi:hypothetical protein